MLFGAFSRRDVGFGGFFLAVSTCKEYFGRRFALNDGWSRGVLFLCVRLAWRDPLSGIVCIAFRDGRTRGDHTRDLPFQEGGHAEFTGLWGSFPLSFGRVF